MLPALLQCIPPPVSPGAGPGREALAPYVAFHAALRSAHASFAARLEGEARGLLAHHLDAATSEFALALMAPGPGQVGGWNGW